MGLTCIFSEEMRFNIIMAFVSVGDIYIYIFIKLSSPYTFNFKANLFKPFAKTATSDRRFKLSDNITHHIISTKETFLQYFLLILKQSRMEEMFPYCYL